MHPLESSAGIEENFDRIYLKSYQEIKVRESEACQMGEMRHLAPQARYLRDQGNPGKNQNKNGRPNRNYTEYIYSGLRKIRCKGQQNGIDRSGST